MRQPSSISREPTGYDLSGLGGVPKYLGDYSTLATGGLTGNLAVTYLGSYDVEYGLSNGAVPMFVTNRSTAASGFRPPVIGYTKWWNNSVGAALNRTFGAGPMSATTQNFAFTTPCPWIKEERSMQFLRRLTLVAAAIATMSCGTPSEADLAGTWIPTDSSRDRLREEYGKTVAAQLVLASDGTFTAVELPIGRRLYADDPVAYQGTAERGVLIDCRGHWSIIHAGSLQIRLSFEETAKDYRIHLPSAAQFAIRRGLRKYRLWHFAGDPDTGNAIYFDRVTAEEAPFFLSL